MSSLCWVYYYVAVLALATVGAGVRAVPGAADATANGNGLKEETVAVLAGASCTAEMAGNPAGAGDGKNFIAFGGVGRAAGMEGGILPGFGAGIRKYGGISGGAGTGGIGGVIPVGGSSGSLPGVLPGGLPGALPGGLPGALPGCIDGMGVGNTVIPVRCFHGGGSLLGTGSGGLPLP